MPLIETRTAEEARLIIAKRLQQDPRDSGTDPTLYFGPQFFEEFGGLSTRRILELAQTRMREQEGDADRVQPEEKPRLHLDAGRGARAWRPGGVGHRRPTVAGASDQIEFRELWERFTAQSEAEIPADDQSLLDVLAGALALASEEWGGADRRRPSSAVAAGRRSAGDRPHPAPHDGLQRGGRIFLCNRPTQGGGLKRQLDRVLRSDGRQDLLHAARERLPAQQEEPDGAGLPQVPREGRALAAGADPRLGAHDDGARVPRPASARSRASPTGSSAPSCCRTCRRWSSCCGSTCSGRSRASRRRCAGGAWSHESARRWLMARSAAAAAGRAARCRLDRLGHRAACRRRTEGRPAAVRAARRGRRRRRQHPGRPRAAVQQEHHAQQGRAEAPRRRARRLRLRQDHAGAVHHRAAAAARARRRC